jgi:hypothetical protein
MQHKKLQGDIESKNIGINQKGGGGKGKLEIKEQVCLSLFYLRKMPTFEVFALRYIENGSKGHISLLARDITRCFPASLLEQVEKHDSDYAMATQNIRQETKSFPPRVLFFNRSLDL